ncbi:MAG TPA: septum formation initiator family protein [Candidatus Nanoarchaeia archaeon]|nr:septum formation initiator family protein [Candidatus Nanoarchaeia archaeon]
MKKNRRNFFTGIFLAPYFFTLACLIIIAAIIVPVFKNARERFSVNSQVADLQRQIASLEASNNDLTALEKYLQSDQYAETEARLNLNLKMPGERVAVIENSGAGGDQSGNGSGDNNPDKKNSNPMKWWNYFFGQ